MPRLGVKPKESMEFKINFKNMPTYVLIKTEGVPSIQNFDALLKSLVDSPKWITGTDQIVDHRKLVIDNLIPDDVKGVRDIVKKYSKKLGNGRCAFIVKNELGFGFIRMYELSGGEKFHIEVRIFHSISEAVKWIDKKNQNTKGKD